MSSRKPEKQTVTGWLTSYPRNTIEQYVDGFGLTPQIKLLLNRNLTDQIRPFFARHLRLMLHSEEYARKRRRDTHET